MIKISYQGATFEVDSAEEAATLLALLRGEERRAEWREWYARHVAERVLYEETGVRWRIRKPKKEPS